MIQSAEAGYGGKSRQLGHAALGAFGAARSCLAPHATMPEMSGRYDINRTGSRLRFP